MSKGLAFEVHPTFGSLLLGKHGYARPRPLPIDGDEGRQPVGALPAPGTLEGEFEVLEISDEEASRLYWAQLHPRIAGA